MEAAERVWCSLVEGQATPAMDYRKPLLIYWFMSHIIKYKPTFLHDSLSLTWDPNLEPSCCGEQTRRLSSRSKRRRVLRGARST